MILFKETVPKIHLMVGDGIDTVTYKDATAGVTVDLSKTEQDTINDGVDTLLNFENLTGSTHNDNLSGNDGVNTLKGLAGDDTFHVVFNDGNDVIDGGNNSDTVDYSAIAAGYHVEVDLSTTNTGIVTNGSTVNQTDTLSSIENIIGTDSDDILIGNSEVNIFDGGAGNDDITGGTGGDTLSGGSGDDIFRGSGTEFTSDVIDGGSGDELSGDTIDYSSITESVIVNLANSGSTSTALINGHSHTVIKHRKYYRLKYCK